MNPTFDQIAEAMDLTLKKSYCLIVSALTGLPLMNPSLLTKKKNQDDDISMEQRQEQNEEQENQQHLAENQPLLCQEQQER